MPWDGLPPEHANHQERVEAVVLESGRTFAIQIHQPCIPDEYPHEIPVTNASARNPRAGALAKLGYSPAHRQRHPRPDPKRPWSTVVAARPRADRQSVAARFFSPTPQRRNPWWLITGRTQLTAPALEMFVSLKFMHTPACLKRKRR